MNFPLKPFRRENCGHSAFQFHFSREHRLLGQKAEDCCLCPLPRSHSPCTASPWLPSPPPATPVPFPCSAPSVLEAPA